jgi:putative transposase
LLLVSDEVWELAGRRAAVICRLAGMDAVGLAAADVAAAELGVSRRLVYVLLARWREGEGVVSDLIPGKSSGGRGRLASQVECSGVTVLALVGWDLAALAVGAHLILWETGFR